MPDLSQLLNPRPTPSGTSGANALHGIIRVPPATATDPIEVVADGYTSQLTYQVAAGHWTPRGTALPQANAACLLVFDEAGDAYMPVYEGLNAFGGGSGGAGGVAFTQQIGDGTATSFVVNHNIGTRSVTVSVFSTVAPYDQIVADIERTTDDTVTIRTLTAPTTNQYTVVVNGPGALSGPGVGDKNYVHTQGAAAATWTVLHNLSKYPAVEAVDSGGNWLLPDVHYVDVNTLTVTFASATSGKVYVN